MNRADLTLTTARYKAIISCMKEGFEGFRPNERAAAALMLEGNLGLRISDVLALRLQDIQLDGNRYRLEIREQKTGRHRCFTAPWPLYQYMENYCFRHGIAPDQRMFPLSTRAIQKQLHRVCDHLGLSGIGTHSFRKWYATQIYLDNGQDIALVQHLLQHSSPETTRRYIGIEEDRVEEAIQKHILLL